MKPELIKNFVATARLFLRHQTLRAPDEWTAYRMIVEKILLEAGFESGGIAVYGLRGYYKDQDGSHTGETYAINRRSPFAVLSLSYPLDDQGLASGKKLQDHMFDYRASLWLETLVQLADVHRDDQKMEEAVANKIAETIPFTKIRLTPQGDMIRQHNGVDAGTRDSDDLENKYLIHDRCNCFMDLKPCSDEWKVIVCRGCHLRIYIPTTTKTFGDLRNYMTEALSLAQGTPT